MSVVDQKLVSLCQAVCGAIPENMHSCRNRGFYWQHMLCISDYKDLERRMGEHSVEIDKK